MSSSNKRPKGWKRIFRFPLSRFQLERDIDDELAFHLEKRAEKLAEQGLRDEHARERAQERFGDVAAVRAECRKISGDRQRLRRLRLTGEELAQDLRSASRSLRRSPVFTLSVIAILAVGIASATACFSLLWQVVLRPLPMPEPERVHSLGMRGPYGADLLSPGIFLRLEENSRSLESIAAMTEVGVTLTGQGLPERLEGLRVSRDYFKVLGAQAWLGNGLEAAGPGEAAAVLSYRLWQRRFDGAPGIVGHNVELDGVAHRIVGVMPRSLDLTTQSMELWLPLVLPPSQRDNLKTLYLGSIGRLRPQATAELLRQELTALRDEHQLTDSQKVPLEVHVPTLSEWFYGDLKPRLWLLLAVVGSVLLIACGNVANLLLALGISRQHEFGIRAALGAGRGRLTRQILIESASLGTLGALFGALGSHSMVTALTRAIPIDLPRLHDVGLDTLALTFAIATGLLSALLAGWLPARRLASRDLQAQLVSGSRSGETPSTYRLRDVLVAAQVAVTTLLVMAAGLLVQTLLNLERVDLGFEARTLVTAQLALPRADYPDAAKAMSTYLEVVAEIERLPGVETATVTSGAPFAGFTGSGGFHLGSQSEQENAQAGLRLVGPASFETYGIPLLAGRGIRTEDRRDSQPVAVINRALARQLGIKAGDESTLLGSNLLSNLRDFTDAAGEPLHWRVVGVAQDVSSGNLRAQPRPTVYLPMTQTPAAPWEWSGRRMLLAARVPGEPAAVVQDLRAAVAGVDPKLPIFDVRSMEQRLHEAMVVERLLASILSVVGLLGLVLATGGIFALVAFMVGQRNREIGVRLALGATVNDLRRRFVGRGMRPVLAGLVIGATGAVASARLLEELLFGVSAVDTRTFLVVSSCLAVAALLACYLPTGAIAKIDPVHALKDE